MKGDAELQQQKERSRAATKVKRAIGWFGKDDVENL